ncbi:GIY-YIG nuclease family protein [Sphingomonas sp. LaA6.9]|uniref:GIY-YIG nuclease family protein n=1 Tax=Sphingomonas sp. LaA6.9 TaxID=2919914 RepID=UPI001F4F5C16|nr:GIY-YIG nuclease family protein [Sphingomonas sp. LaA6.9]MCJ8158651.1 GIY-YIG nuclease family protein [Sphingomonas sp. LaA6.9]
MSSAVGRSLELYYIDGRPDGMLTAELFNWTGHVLMAPRTQIAEALARPEASYAGVYLLIGEEEGEPRAYVGEGEDISARIRSHDVRKEWWTSAVLITAAANKLNKAHVRYLEARLIAEARTIGRVPLDNNTSPTPAILSEADIAKMEAFLENLFIVLPAVRVDMFIQRTRPVPAQSTVRRPASSVPEIGSTVSAPFNPEPRFVLEMRKDGFKAEAVQNEAGEFVVLTGSSARESHGPSSYASLYRDLRREGVIGQAEGRWQFLQNYAFKSPSAAASVATGRSANGAKDWKQVATGRSYKEWEAQKLNAEVDALFDEPIR